VLTWQLAAQPERADRRGQTDEVETAGRSTSGATSAPFLLGPPQALAESRRSSWARNAVPGHESSLDSYGWTMLKTLLTANECATIAGLYEDDRRFRSHVVMARHGFGRGEYKYLAYPLPDILAELRTALYPRLAPRRAAKVRTATGRRRSTVRPGRAHAAGLKIQTLVLRTRPQMARRACKLVCPRMCPRAPSRHPNSDKRQSTTQRETPRQVANLPRGPGLLRGLEGRCSIQLSSRRVLVFCEVGGREASFSVAWRAGQRAGPLRQPHRLSQRQSCVVQKEPTRGGQLDAATAPTSDYGISRAGRFRVAPASLSGGAAAPYNERDDAG